MASMERDSMSSWRLELACHEVQEGQPLKVLGLLIAELHDLVVALPESLHSQPVPCLLVINLLQDSSMA